MMLFYRFHPCSLRRLIHALAFAALMALPLAACKQESAAKPPAIAMPADALGYYCQMYLIDHVGPKAQIHVATMEQPLWFTQVSDAINYLRGGERIGDIRAVYVSDMARAESWDNPGATNWIEAEKAFFVIESRRLGGMGTPEVIPFGSEDAAKRFTAEEGGRVVMLADIPESYTRPPNEGAAINADDLQANTH